MSALMVDEFLPDECMMVDEAARIATRPRLSLVDPAEPRRARADVGSVRLTNRGIAVILAIFAALMVTSVVVIVTSFLSVSNEPLNVGDADSAAVLTVP